MIFCNSLCVCLIFYVIVTKECPIHGDFKCNDTGKCVRSHRICVGSSSCNDGSDQENCGMNGICIYFTFFKKRN